MNYPVPNDEMLEYLVPEGTILLGYRGSVSHGMYIPGESKDVDLLGVMIAPLSHYYGLANYLGKNGPGNGVFEAKTSIFDSVTYELRKFVGLCAKGNPNTLPLLWNEPDMMLQEDDFGLFLRQNRHIFSSKALFGPFASFAMEQIKHTPETNPGYFTKAAHSIRLLRMLKEFLYTGYLNVFRDDFQDILDIKRGIWTPGLINSEAKSLLTGCEIARDASKLPEHPNMDSVNALLIDCLEKANY